MRKRKVLVLVHQDLVPPEKFTFGKNESAPFKTEYDVVSNLKKLKHDVEVLGVLGDLDLVRKKIDEYKPDIVFNLLEEFDEKIDFDQHIVSYLELKKVPYTGCNPRGLTLARDKALSKKILSYHRIPVPKFAVFPKGQKIKVKKDMPFPMIVKSLVEEASMGISQASVVSNEEDLKKRVDYIHKALDTDAIVEEYIKGREFYVGVFGNKRLKLLPIWELVLENLPDGQRKFATSRVKWNEEYRKKYGIKSKPAASLSDADQKRIFDVVKKTYKNLGLTGYARIDIRFSDEGKVYVIEANPNPGIAYGEEFTESAEKLGMSYQNVLNEILKLGLNWYKSRS